MQRCVRVLLRTRALAVTKSQAEKFAHALERLKNKSSKRAGVGHLLLKAEQDALRSQLVDLQSQMKAYEALRSGTRATEVLRP